MPSDATNLPTNIDSTYPDSPTDSSVEPHQHHHDVVHQFTNTHSTNDDPHGDRAYAKTYTDQREALIRGDVTGQIAAALGTAGNAVQVDANNSPYVDIASGGSAPAAVASLTAGTPTGTKVPLSWPASSGATTYLPEYQIGSGPWTAATAVSTNSTTVTGLSRETTYKFRVTAQNTNGAAPPSPTATVTTPYSPILGWSGTTVPGMTQEIFATWMARDTWSNLANTEWIMYDGGYTTFLGAHPDRALDLGVPLVPHNMSGGNVATMLDEVVAGSHDATFTSMGTNLAKNTPKTSYFRFFWEMNQNIGQYNFTGTQFINAWNHAVPIIMAAYNAQATINGRGQVAYRVFSPITDGKTFTNYYPGDTNVDIIAPDLYAQIWGTTTPTSSALLASVNSYLSTYISFAASHSKGMALGEWANCAVKTQGVTDSQGRGDFPEFIDAIIASAVTNRFVYLPYYNLPDGATGQTFANTPNSLTHYVAAQ